MNREEIFEKLTTVFREDFEDDSIVLTDETTSDDIEDWDSLEHVNLIVSVENEFGMKFSMGDVSTMKNVGDMVSIIEDRT